MIQRNKKCYLIVLFILVANCVTAQLKTTKVPLFTADSIQSGNTKDIATNFFQLALNNLIGSNREFNFSASPFAIMLKRNPDLNLDTKYKKNKPLRKMNISFGIKMDSSFNFNGFSSALKYSIIDETDATTSKIIAERLQTSPLNIERKTLLKELSKRAKTLFPNANEIDHPDYKRKDSFIQKTNQIIQDKPFNELDQEFQNILTQVVEENKLYQIANIFENKGDSSFKDIDIQKFEYLKNSIKNNLLWTIGLSDTTYNDKFQFSNIVIFSELSKGLFSPEQGDNNLEINAKIAYNFSNDTIEKNRNLNREILTLEAGLNWVIRDKKTDKSFFEVKLSTSYYHNFTNLYINESRDIFTLNITPRLRIYEDIWIPVELKYNPANSNLFGFLNVKANFTGLSKLLKSK